MNVRRTVIAALVTIVILAVALFVVSKYVQPVLPYGLSSDFLLIAACLIAVATFLAALKDVVELAERVVGRRGSSSRSNQADTAVGVSSLTKEVGFETVEPVNYKEYYSNDTFLRLSSGQDDTLYHAEVFLNTEGLDKSRFRFIHQGDFQIARPVFSELEQRIAARLDYNETRLRVAKIVLKEAPLFGKPSLHIYCQRATYSQVLVTNHSDELVFNGQSLRDVFAPSLNGKLPPLEKSSAANPAGCNCLLETNDNYFVIQIRSDLVQTNRLQYTPSVSGGTEYSRPFPLGNLDPFLQLFLEMSEEIGLEKGHLAGEPMLLAISRDVQRNGLPEFFFYARLGLDYDQVQAEIKKRRGSDSWEHTGVFALPSQEAEMTRYMMDQQSSLALRANLAYYMKLKGVVREPGRRG